MVPRNIFVPEADWKFAPGFFVRAKEDNGMNGMNQIHIADCTLLEASGNVELSFREKIELCRLIDKLGVSAIEMNQIRQAKVDSLLIKSVCSVVRNATVSVPVKLNDPESVRMTWEALKEAPSSRLQVVVPVSSVQMEYLLHMKPQVMLNALDFTIRACKALTDDVEFIASDATRSDPAFLRETIRKAISAGASVVTICDTAASMMPGEIAALLNELRRDIPQLGGIRIGFFCSGELNLADACAFSAVRAGASEIKTITCAGNCISLANIVRILKIKGPSAGVQCLVGSEQIRRISSQVQNICSSGRRKTILTDEDPLIKDSDEVLNAHDSFETVIRAAEHLGYDLNAEDQQKVWKCFCQTAEKKEQITLRELDAIIAAEALQVPPAYHNIQYVINTGNQIGAMAHMKLMFHNESLEGIASGDGAIDAAFNSIEKATGRHFELDEFRIQAITEGREAIGETIVRLRWEGKLYSGRGISTDIVGAGIMAYLNAVNKIVYEEEEA